MPKLFMVLLGCRPAGRNTEQHDVYFGIAEDIAGLVPGMKAFWPGTELHIDAYLEIERIADYTIRVEPVTNNTRNNKNERDLHLYFINLGGYLPPEFEEFHKKLLIVAPDVSEAQRRAKQDSFYRTGQTLGTAARSHIDDRMEIDEIMLVQDLFHDIRIVIENATDVEPASQPIIGYLPLSRLKDA
jgi:hypothetical protein